MVAGTASGRQDRRPVAVEGEGGDEPDAVEVGLGHQADAGVGCRLLHLVAEGRPGGRQEKRYLVEVGHGQIGGLGQRVADRHHQHQVLVEQGPSDDVGTGHRQVDDGQLEASSRELRLQRGRGGLDHGQVDLGMGDGHPFEQPGDQPPGRRTDHAEPDAPFNLVAEGGHVGHHGLDLAGDASGPLDDSLALLGQLTPMAVDQLDAELLLQPGDVVGHIGLDRVQGVGGQREASTIGDGDDGGELAKIHGYLTIPTVGDLSLTEIGLIDYNCWTDCGRHGILVFKRSDGLDPPRVPAPFRRGRSPHRPLRRARTHSDVV